MNSKNVLPMKTLLHVGLSLFPYKKRQQLKQFKPHQGWKKLWLLRNEMGCDNGGGWGWVILGSDFVQYISC